jgi:hypothetical protein
MRGNTVHISAAKIWNFLSLRLELTSLPVFQNPTPERNWEISHQEVRDKLWKLGKGGWATKHTP